MNALLTIFFFILIISLLVFVHELGHFLAAKISKVDVFEFSLGFGPKIYEKSYKGTNYQIRAFPLGGYVQLEGEQDSASPNGFRNKKLPYKIFILTAGVFMNFVIAVVFLGINLERRNYEFELPVITNYSFTNTASQFKAFPIVVDEVFEGGNSDGQLFPGDVIIGIDGERFVSREDYKNKLEEKQGKEVTMEFLEWDGLKTYEKQINIGYANEEGQILQGRIYFPYEHDIGDDKRTYFIIYKSSFVSAFAQTYDLTVFQMKALANMIGSSVSSGNYSELADSVGGPVALENNVNEVVKNKAYEAFPFLTALISISLAVVNVLPIPALDGGQVAVAVFESIRRKRISDKTLERMNSLGFLFVISLSFLITVKDIINFDVLGSLKDLINSALGR